MYTEAEVSKLKRDASRNKRELGVVVEVQTAEIVVLEEEVEQGGTDVTVVVDDLRAKQVLVKADLVTIRSEVNTQHGPGIWPALDDLLIHMDEECDAILAAYPEGWPT
jgi:hypothetical protein